ncbi:MAG: hypothetical protein ACO1PI_10220 [Bacteroidota bacterium]
MGIKFLILSLTVYGYILSFLKMNKFFLFLTVLSFVCCQPSKTESEKSIMSIAKFDSILGVVKKDDSVHKAIDSILQVHKIKSFYKKYNKLDESGERTGVWCFYFDHKSNEVNFMSDYSYCRVLSYKNGKVVGEIKEFYKNGNTKWSGHLVLNNYNGLCNWYDTTGKLIRTVTYKNGFKNGRKIEYIDDKAVSIWTYKDDLHNGVHIEYCKENPNNLILKENYLQGKLHGIYQEYYRSGKKQTIGYYNKGKKTGSWYYYDEDGDYRATRFMNVRVGAICKDGWRSHSTGRGTCSWHGGVNYWLVESLEITVSATGKYNSRKY